ncbi:MAG: SDR family oxidoreductase [Bacteroidota bacterium]
MQDIKTALITGGSKGIGYAIAEKLINDGIKVVITARSKEEVEKAAESLNEIKVGYALGFQSDVKNLASQEAVVQEIINNWGRLDYVIANAGVGHFAPIQELTSEQWQETIDINLTGVFNSIKASYKALKETKGYFISIASLAGTNFFEKGGAYNASKFGLVGFSQAIMMDLRKDGIKVSTIMPGSVATYFNGHIPNENDAWKIQPEDIGQIVSDLIKMPARTLPSKIEVRPSFPK